MSTLESAKELMRNYLPDLVDNEKFAYLFINDPETSYIISHWKNEKNENLSQKNVSHLQKCIYLTKEYPKMNEYLKEYLKTCNNIDEKTFPYGFTALHLAARNTKELIDFETVKILVDAGANINETTKCLVTILDDAIRFSQVTSTLETVQYLIDLGANVNLQDEQGFSILHTAIIYYGITCNFETIKIILNTNINLNLVTENHNTALHLALKRNCLDKKVTIKMLIDKGANIYIKNNENKCPYDYFDNELMEYCKNKSLNNIIQKMRKVNECEICLAERQVIECPYKHSICGECIVQINTYKCSLCQCFYY